MNRGCGAQGKVETGGRGDAKGKVERGNGKVGKDRRKG